MRRFVLIICVVATLILSIVACSPLKEKIAAILTPTGEILVRVIDSEGSAIPNARVAIRETTDVQSPPTDGAIRLDRKWNFSTEVTNEEGILLLDQVGPGQWYVCAGALPMSGYHFSEPLEMGDEVTIALAPLPQDRLLHGVVLQPDGKTGVQAKVRFVWMDRGEQQVKMSYSDERGTFTLLLDKAGQVGALHASLSDYSFRSTALDPIAAGNTNIQIVLGEPRYLTLELRDPDGSEILQPRIECSWLLAGSKYRDGGRNYLGWEFPFDWELPDCPFYLSIYALNYEDLHLGPLHEDQVGSLLSVQMKPLPRLHGRVTRNGMPVEAATVSMHPDRESESLFQMSEPLLYARGNPVETDESGQFSLVLKREGRCVLRAWSPKAGEGWTGALQLDSSELPQNLEIAITDAPGSVTGKVIIPPGHEASEIWLTTNRGRGFKPLEPDGSFTMLDMPPGPLAIRIRKSFGGNSSFQPLSTTVSRSDAGWVLMSHGPERAPDWLTIEPAFEVEVLSGQTVSTVLDLTNAELPSLDGRLLLNEEPVLIPPPAQLLWSEETPRVVLDRGHWMPYVSRTELSDNGSFTLRAQEQGEYFLSITIPIEDDLRLHLRDQVTLSKSNVFWERDIPTGSLRVLPRDRDGVVTEFRGEIHWIGSGDMSAVAYRGQEDRQSREVFYPSIPAGKIQLIWRSGGERELLLEGVVVAGQTTTVQCP